MNSSMGIEVACLVLPLNSVPLGFHIPTQESREISSKHNGGIVHGTKAAGERETGTITYNCGQPQFFLWNLS